MCCNVCVYIQVNGFAPAGTTGQSPTLKQSDGIIARLPEAVYWDMWWMYMYIVHLCVHVYMYILTGSLVLGAGLIAL